MSKASRFHCRFVSSRKSSSRRFLSEEIEISGKDGALIVGGLEVIKECELGRVRAGPGRSAALFRGPEEVGECERLLREKGLLASLFGAKEGDAGSLDGQLLLQHVQQAAQGGVVGYDGREVERAVGHRVEGDES